MAPEGGNPYPSQMSTAARILARGEIVVGVRYDLEPFSSSRLTANWPVWRSISHVELARRWLGSTEAVRFRQVRSDTAYQYVADGTVDLVFAGLAHTQDSEARADFSPAYFDNGMALLISRYGHSGTGGAHRQAGRRPALDRQWGGPIRIHCLNTTVITYDHYFDVIRGLRLREVDAYADHAHRLERARRTITGATVVGKWTAEPVAMIFPSRTTLSCTTLCS